MHVWLAAPSSERICILDNFFFFPERRGSTQRLEEEKRGEKNHILANFFASERRSTQLIEKDNAEKRENIQSVSVPVVKFDSLAGVLVGVTLLVSFIVFYCL